MAYNLKRRNKKEELLDLKISYLKTKKMNRTAGVLLVATNKYKQFVPSVLEGIEKFLLPDWNVVIHLFTDTLEEKYEGFSRITVVKHLIPAHTFPAASLYRYRFFTEQAETLSKHDFLIYSDVDMQFCAPIQEDFLCGDIIAVRHPGFYANNGWGSPGNNPESLSYLTPELCKKYFCGGVQGGKADKYLTICKRLAEGIDHDTAKGIQAIYHDETFWNAALNWFIPLDYPDWKICEHTPEYCSVPELHQRQMWGIDHLPARIIALSKDHNYFRS